MVGFDQPTPAPADAGSRSRRQGAAVLVVVAALTAGGLADVGHVVAPGETLDLEVVVLDLQLLHLGHRYLVDKRSQFCVLNGCNCWGIRQIPAWR